jgi:hypothetical protein
MLRPLALVALWLGFASALPARQAPAPPPGALIEGTVYDTLSGSGIRVAVVRARGSDQSVLTDDKGRFRIPVAPGPVDLQVRRVGYRPTSVRLTAGAGITRRDIYLHPIPVELAAFVVEGVEDPARRIMRAVIARKQSLLARLHDYRYDAYVKFVVRDLEKPPDSASSVLLITETRTEAYWERPDTYVETILARRQSSNLRAEGNLVSVGEIVNFQKDRIDLEKYAVVSPIADDALDHYRYRLLDTLEVNGQRVLRLSLEPGSQAVPLFLGVLDVADSMFDVLAIDVGLNDAVRVNFLSNLRYAQRLRDMGGGRWMPYEIRFTGEVHFGVPIPGFPEHLSFEHVASLDRFRFDQGERPAVSTEYRILVDDHADRPDSATWAGAPPVPLSGAERAAWKRIDSLERAPATLGKRVRQGLGLTLLLATDPDFFHFSRVEGPYVGAGWTLRPAAGLSVTTGLGYATGSKTWQHQWGADVRLSQARRLWAGVRYYDGTVARPTLVSRSYDATLRALLFRLDPLDYHRERGWRLSLATKLLDFTRLDIWYHDVRHAGLPVVTDYAVFQVDHPQRVNPPVTEGRLRSLSGALSYDSRPLLRSGGRDFRLQALTWTRLTLGAEVAAPGLVPNDFDYRRYSLHLERRQRTLNAGVTTVNAALGTSTGRLPPQRYFVVDFGMKALTFQGGGFNTLPDSNFAGSRAAMISLRHDFDRLLFTGSRLPLVRDVPFTVSLHGGAFWTGFVGHTANPGDEVFQTAPSAYYEVGLGVGNLTPFLSPINLATYFTWQLSDYPGRRFQLGLGLTPP